MNFFKNKVVQIVAWVLLALSVVVHVIGGVTAETVSKVVVMVAGIVAGVAGLIAFIAGLINAKKSEE